MDVTLETLCLCLNFIYPFVFVEARQILSSAKGYKFYMCTSLQLDVHLTYILWLNDVYMHFMIHDFYVSLAEVDVEARDICPLILTRSPVLV